MRLKKYAFILVILLILSINKIIFANDDFEEEFDFDRLNDFLTEVDSEANEVPGINSRHGVVYDRSTREYIIWKKRE